MQFSLSLQYCLYTPCSSLCHHNTVSTHHAVLSVTTVLSLHTMQFSLSLQYCLYTPCSSLCHHNTVSGTGLTSVQYFSLTCLTSPPLSLPLPLLLPLLLPL